MPDPIPDPSAAAGLSSRQATERLARFGPNELPDTRPSLLRNALAKLWAPVPWMLELAVLLELWLGKHVEAALIAALIVFNAVVALVQEGRARNALAALRSRLALNATVRRDGTWATLPARQLVPGDRVKLSLGDVVPADCLLQAGQVLLDQSMLTGESVPVEAGPGASAWAGALVRRGQAEALVNATGARTRFGRTAQLVGSAHVMGTQQHAVLQVVRNLALFNGTVIALLGLYAWQRGLALVEIEPLVLTAMLASIPIALPATFTLAAALAAHALAERGVLATRLSALDEAGTLDVLCSDKTGTLTLNALQVARIVPASGLDAAQLLTLAALASSDGGSDPVDAAVRAAWTAAAGPSLPQRLAFEPFDPATRQARALYRDATGQEASVAKGAYATLAGAATPDAELQAQAQALEREGLRVLAVATGAAPALRLAGLVALGDPPRPDAAALVQRLREHGVQVLMVTGDAPGTAAAVAHAVGIGGTLWSPGPDATPPAGHAVYAGVLPEDKFHLVRALQQAGHTVGMCGDGANDAPALHQAHMGIAVAQATDVAKAAAGLVLTTPGLSGVMAAIEEGRQTFRRVQTYALNSIIKKVATVLFIALGFVMTGNAILTPLLMIIYLVAGDFLSMAIATDRVQAARTPNVWRIDALTGVAVVLGLAQLGFACALLAWGAFSLRLEAGRLQTLAFLTLVLAGQATIYAIRTRGSLWQTRPSAWLVGASLLDVAVGVTVAASGWFSAALPGRVIAGVLGAALLLTPSSRHCARWRRAGCDWADSRSPAPGRFSFRCPRRRLSAASATGAGRAPHPRQRRRRSAWQSARPGSPCWCSRPAFPA